MEDNVLTSLIWLYCSCVPVLNIKLKRGMMYAVNMLQEMVLFTFSFILFFKKNIIKQNKANSSTARENLTGKLHWIWKLLWKALTLSLCLTKSLVPHCNSEEPKRKECFGKRRDGLVLDYWLNSTVPCNAFMFLWRILKYVVFGLTQQSTFSESLNGFGYGAHFQILRKWTHFYIVGES